MNQTKFQGVEDTLFIPLAARIKASKRFPQYFYDEKALTFENIDQVKKINQKSSEYSMIASVSRYHNFDQMVRCFIDQHPHCQIINLGAGLETMNERLKDTNAHFYEIDFPSVIENRKQVLETSNNETLIGCDLCDLDWIKQIDINKPCLMIASGVFQYLRPEAIFQLIKELKSQLPNSQLIFDATNEVGVKYAQKYVKKTGNQSAMMYFYINDAKAFCKQADIDLIEVRGFYKEARQLKGFNLYTRIAMKVADDKKRTMILHVAL